MLPGGDVIRYHGNKDQERSQGWCDLPLALYMILVAESGVRKQGLQTDQALEKTGLTIPTQARLTGSTQRAELIIYPRDSPHPHPRSKASLGNQS